MTQPRVAALRVGVITLAAKLCSGSLPGAATGSGGELRDARRGTLQRLFPGAATGSGGELRVTLAAGRCSGSLPVAM